METDGITDSLARVTESYRQMIADVDGSGLVRRLLERAAELSRETQRDGLVWRPGTHGGAIR